MVCNERIRTDVSDIGHWFERMETKTNELKVVMEATGFYFWIFDAVEKRDHDVKVVHPTETKSMMKKRSKNDKNDAYMLAELLRLGGLDGIYVPSLEVREMRELTRHRDSLVRKRGDLKREVLAHLLQKGIKVPYEFRTNFSQKHIAWMRSFNDIIMNDKLDVLEVVVEKIVKVERTIRNFTGRMRRSSIRTIPVSVSSPPRSSRPRSATSPGSRPP